MLFSSKPQAPPAIPRQPKKKRGEKMCPEQQEKQKHAPPQQQYTPKEKALHRLLIDLGAIT